MTSQHQIILQVPPNNNTSPSYQQRRRRICFLSLLPSIMTMTMFLLQTLRTTSAVSTRRQWSSTARTTSPAFVSTTTRRQSTIPSITNNDNLFLVHQYSDQRQISLFSSRSSSSSYNNNNDDGILLEESGYHRPPVQWYPGHIAKAERQLSETLKAVDVVVEVRDARACKATAHPRVGEWCAGRPRIVVLTHLDMTPKSAVKAWQRAYKTLGAERWDDTPLNTQVANQANQARQIRFSYDSGNNGSNKNNKKSNNKQQQHQSQQQQQQQQKSSVVTPVEEVLFVNAKQGEGIHMLTRTIFKAGSHVQERRERRGLNPRPLRVGIIGYPNVGKSALINRLLGRRRARTANTPGVTRSLQWIRVRSSDAEGKSSGRTSSDTYKKEFELLDSPGIIPAKMVDQSDALLLAACNCIGQAAYDNQAVAAYLCEWLKALHIMGKSQMNAPQWQSKCIERYGFDPLSTTENDDDEEEMTGEDILFKVADLTCQGNPEDASRKILQDFRTGRMGPISLQVAPETSDDDGQMEVPIYGNNRSKEAAISKQRNEELLREQQDRARIAMETAKERGLELPPMVVEKQQKQKQEETDEKVVVQETNKKNENNSDDDIGKGMFDGW